MLNENRISIEQITFDRKLKFRLNHSLLHFNCSELPNKPKLNRQLCTRTQTTGLKPEHSKQTERLLPNPPNLIRRIEVDKHAKSMNGRPQVESVLCWIIYPLKMKIAIKEWQCHNGAHNGVESSVAHQLLSS